jgi:hypothetical protein
VKLYRPATVLVGVALVIIAGLIRLAEPEERLDDVSRYAVRGSVGKPLDGKDFTLTVTRVKFARAVDPRPDDDDANARPEDKPIKTSGIFVTVEYEMRGRHETGSAGEATLKADGGSVYVPISKGLRTQLNIPQPGFVESASLVFEANPDDLVGLTLRAKQLQVLSRTTEDYAIDLGVGDEAVAKDMLEHAENMYPLTRAKTRAAS